MGDAKLARTRVPCADQRWLSVGARLLERDPARFLAEIRALSAELDLVEPIAREAAQAK